MLLFRIGLLVSSTLIRNIRNEPANQIPPQNYSYNPGFGHTATLGTEVELSVSCTNLLDRDIFSKSDPMCVTYIRSFHNPSWEEFHRSEIVHNSLNPAFVQKPMVPYTLELSQSVIKFELYDVDSTSARLQSHDHLGYAECSLQELVNSGKTVLPLRKRDWFNVEKNISKSQITIVAENLIVNHDKVHMELIGSKIAKKDFFGSSDPYMEIFKHTEKGGFQLVYRTEVIDNTRSPRWRSFAVPMKNLCNGNHERTLKFICWDYDRGGKRDYIGEFETTLGAILHRQVRSFQLKDTRKKRNRISGEISVVKLYVETLPTFAPNVGYSSGWYPPAQQGYNASMAGGLHYMPPPPPLYHAHSTAAYHHPPNAAYAPPLLPQYAPHQLPDFGRVTSQSNLQPIYGGYAQEAHYVDPDMLHYDRSEIPPHYNPSSSTHASFRRHHANLNRPVRGSSLQYTDGSFRESFHDQFEEPARRDRHQFVDKPFKESAYNESGHGSFSEPNYDSFLQSGPAGPKKPVYDASSYFVNDGYKKRPYDAPSAAYYDDPTQTSSSSQKKYAYGKRVSLVGDGFQEPAYDSRPQSGRIVHDYIVEPDWETPHDGNSRFKRPLPSAPVFEDPVANSRGSTRGSFKSYPPLEPLIDDIQDRVQRQ